MVDTPPAPGDHMLPHPIAQPSQTAPALAHPGSSFGGGHEIPARFPDAAALPLWQPRRRRRRGPILGTVAAVVAVLAFTGLQVVSNRGYDAAAAEFDSALSNAQNARETLRADTESVQALRDETQTIVDSDSGLLVPPETKATVTSALESSGDVLEESEATLESPLPEREEKPGWFWELYGATAAVDAKAEQAEQVRTSWEEDDRLTRESAGALSGSALTMIETAAAAAPAFEGAHISAKNLDVIALREAAASAQDLGEVDQVAVDAFTTLDDAAEQVVASEQAELAEKAGPLQGARLEIEAFARSLAPGVLMDFDWAPIVNGYGYDGSMGGYTSWWYADPGYATLELSNSIAEQWPADRSKAIVAHEVGHAISVKCQGMYDDSTADSIEKWATAWAISMGFADDANGVWAYGYPPQSYIDAAAGCR